MGSVPVNASAIAAVPARIRIILHRGTAFANNVFVGLGRISAVRIIGGGPAGSAAAIVARQHGAEVEILEKSRMPHHKVCGEFISPEGCQVLNELGVWPKFLNQDPTCIRRCCLRFGSRVKEWKLAQPAFGLSRFELDRLLLDHATASGANVVRGQRWTAQERESTHRIILAIGRGGTAQRSSRLFGFKSHFEGPSNDAVEVFFDGSSYIGVSAIEHGMTNVCGIASEAMLRRYNFRFDDFVNSSRALTERLSPLRRSMAWLSTGPLIFSDIWCDAAPARYYPAGDALGFVDPFTGSGILNALLTGRMAGWAAAQCMGADVYLRACRRTMSRPYAVSALFRALLNWGCAGYLATCVPGQWMYRMTRAAFSAGWS
jgi:flavin-dependent dehydrogenase